MGRRNLTIVVGTARSCGVRGGALTGRADALCSSARRPEAQRALHVGLPPQRANSAAVNSQARPVQRQPRKIHQAAVARRHELVDAIHPLANT
jgi:hypothetical protein